MLSQKAAQNFLGCSGFSYLICLPMSIFKFKKFVDTSPYCLLYDKPFCNRSQEEYLPQRHRGPRCRVRDACRCPAKVNPAH